MKKTSQNEIEHASIHNITYALILLSLFLPYLIQFQTGNGWHFFQIQSFLASYVDWTNIHGDGITEFRISGLNSLPFIFLFHVPVYVFLYYVDRHLHGMTTLKQVVLIGILSQIPKFVAFCLSILLLYATGNAIIMIPVPLLAVLGILVSKLRGFAPPQEPWDNHLTVE